MPQIYLGQFETYLLASGLVAIVFAAGWKGGGKRILNWYVTHHKEIIEKIYIRGVKDTLDAIDKKFIEMDARGIEVPRLKIKVSGLKIESCEEVPRPNANL